MLFGKSTMIIGGGINIGDTSSIMDRNGSFQRVPTAAEYAAANNMPFNTEADTSKLGKIGTQSKLDDDEGDGGVGGEGGFLWSF
jgi:hypothetical protein